MATPPTYTCVHSASNGTCQGYACITKFITRPGQNSSTTIDRKCQKLYQYVDELEMNEIVQDSLLPFCVTDTSYDMIGVMTEVECYCYSNQCNAEETDTNWPLEFESGAPILPNSVITCTSEICNSTSCTSIGQNNTCTGQYCYTGKLP